MDDMSGMMRVYDMSARSLALVLEDYHGCIETLRYTIWRTYLGCLIPDHGLSPMDLGLLADCSYFREPRQHLESLTRP